MSEESVIAAVSAANAKAHIEHITTQIPSRPRAATDDASAIPRSGSGAGAPSSGPPSPQHAAAPAARRAQKVLPSLSTMEVASSRPLTMAMRAVSALGPVP